MKYFPRLAHLASLFALTALYLLLATASVFAEPPEIVTAPKGVKAIHREFWISYLGKGGEFKKWNEEIGTFDENGRMISLRTEYPDKESWCTDYEEKFVYDLDDKGRVLEMSRTLNSYLQQVWIYEYKWDGSFSVSEYRCDVDEILCDDPEETWQFDAKGQPLSMEAYNNWGYRKIKYEYFDLSQPDRRHPEFGNGRLRSIRKDSYNYESKELASHYEDFRVYGKNNRLEILYDYDDRGATVAKIEYDDREDVKLETYFSNEIKDGKWLWSAPVARYEHENSYCNLRGIELRDTDIEVVIDIKYPQKGADDWSPDYSQEGTEILTVVRKHVYRYEFTEEFLKESEKKEKEEKKGK